MNSHEIHNGHDTGWRTEEGQDYVEDDDDIHNRGQDYLDDDDDYGSGILNKVMDSAEMFNVTTLS